MSLILSLLFVSCGEANTVANNINDINSINSIYNGANIETFIVNHPLVCFLSRGKCRVGLLNDYVRGIDSAFCLSIRARIRNGLISIPFEKYDSDVVSCSAILGTDVASAIITVLTDIRYFAIVGREFLFSRDCMWYEIKAHMDGYLYVSGADRSSIPLLVPSSVLYYGFYKHYSVNSMKKQVVGSLASADLSEKDMRRKHQRLFFRYDKSIRNKK